jgi:hypothetical protein
MGLCIAQGIERSMQFIDLVNKRRVYISAFRSPFDVVSVKGRVLMGGGVGNLFWHIYPLVAPIIA